MGTIVVFENVSLDGVTQDPTGEEGFGRDDWRARLAPGDRAAWAELILDDASRAKALLLGRRSYEFFAARYPHRSGALADRLNGLPKYVVSATLTDPAWNNATVLAGGVVDEVSALREKVDGEIRVYASSHLVHTLMEHDLVDELRLAVFPLVMGAGDRVFDQKGVPDPRTLRLVDTRRVGDGLAHLTYRCVPSGNATATASADRTGRRRG
ncbi:dihydrofolate reductase family protein [Streptacidiphilus rugosus]|uniref:dihydrofolate reductase family protein n=1 Tax=Streptacidiphilus rugosus TaxID=405783 RepID=UPI0006896611|nr:dihydrofolate reductase family protein [Streptacidiphilus rugosus]